MYTFRAHQGPVLCLAMSATGEECFSGGVDSTIRCWNLPSSNIDPYDSYGKIFFCLTTVVVNISLNHAITLEIIRYR
mgnify:CR=1 FL=1